MTSPVGAKRLVASVAGEIRDAVAFPPGFLDELRTRVPLAELIGRRVRLTRHGREYAGLCPFHNEKTPSFYVVEDKGFFHCFGCGAHGDAIGFVMRADSLDFIEAIERLAGEAGLAVPQQTPQERERAQHQKTQLEALAAATDFYESQLWSASGAPAREYLFRRGLDDDAIRQFRLGWAPEDRRALRHALTGDFPETLLTEAGLLRQPEDGGIPYDYFRARVMFPIGDRAGRTIAFGGRTLGDSQPKYLNSPDTPLFTKGHVLYAWAQARANIARAGDGPASVIVVEGYMDVIALHRGGFGTAVATLGTALTEFHLQELWRLSSEPVLCFDGDAAGQRAASRALGRALPLLQAGRSVQFAKLPSGEDPDIFLRARGTLAFEQEVLAPRQPLWSMLWNEEFYARPTDTPERRADFRKRLKGRIDTILDTVLRGEFWGFLLDKFYNVVRSSRLSRLREERSRRGARDEPPPPPPDPRPIQRTMLLADLIDLPEEIEGHVEEISMLEFPGGELDKLRWELLEITDIHRGLDSEGMRQRLGENGLAETVGALFSRISSHGLPRRSRDPETIRSELRELFLVLGHGDRSDLETAARAFGFDPTPENWNRLQSLKEREFMEHADREIH